MEIYFITGNKNKFEEAKSVIPELQQLDIDLPEIQEIDAKTIIKAKLAEAFRHKQSEFIVEDTSLYLDCLNGLPGPLIKWFLKTIGNDGLARLANSSGNAKAEAKTMIGFAKSIDDVHYFEGSLDGTIVSPRGDTSFGWDPIFQPEGSLKNFAEMSGEEKNAISMRKIAFTKLKQFIEPNPQ
jgi:non-canonical purine NTP pyrophosphatase (RdgB/HAM1 family)